MRNKRQIELYYNVREQFQKQIVNSITHTRAHTRTQGSCGAQEIRFHDLMGHADEDEKQQ